MATVYGILALQTDWTGVYQHVEIEKAGKKADSPSRPIAHRQQEAHD